MASGKNFSGWVPGDYVERAEARAKALGKSEYVAALIKADVDNAPPDLSSRDNVLLELARHFHPSLVDELALHLNHGPEDKPVNQSLIVARFLDALLDGMKSKRGFNPEQGFRIYTNEEQFVESVRQQPGMLRALQLVAESGEFYVGAGEAAGKVSPATAEEKERAKKIAAQHLAGGRKLILDKKGSGGKATGT